MKTFKQYLKETENKTFYDLVKANWSENDHELWKDKKHLRPAIQDGTQYLPGSEKDKAPRKVYIGKVGDTHEDIKNRHNLSGYSHRDGMYHMRTKQFHQSAIDSTDLMTPMMRQKKFGVQESKNVKT